VSSDLTAPADVKVKKGYSYNLTRLYAFMVSTGNMLAKLMKSKVFP
jgi:hypothetical protein